MSNLKFTFSITVTTIQMLSSIMWGHFRIFKAPSNWKEQNYSDFFSTIPLCVALFKGFVLKAHTCVCVCMSACVYVFINSISNSLGLSLLCPYLLTAAAAKSLQSCLALCDSIDSSPPGSPIPGILQARTLERVAISFSNAWKWKVKVKSLSPVRIFTTPWTAAHQAPPSMGFFRQEDWSGVPVSSPTF